MKTTPNILLLVMDSARARNLSCYGYNRQTTPNIDALAGQGALFQKAFSVGCWTLPVHASLFTGLYPLNHNVVVSRDALPKDYPTLAYRLKQLGYRTASFSTNPYISEMTGLTRGFDTVVDLWRTAKPRGLKRTKSSRLIKKLEPYRPWTKPAIWMVRKLQKARFITKRRRSPEDKGTLRTNQEILSWLTNLKPEQPFFVYVNYMQTHEPYRPPAPYDQRFMPGKYSSWRVAQVDDKKTILQKSAQKQGSEDLEILRALYDGELNYLDEQIGELVKSLQNLGILDNTMIVITADHGDCLGEHQHIGHRVNLYEQLVHVPLIIRYPQGFQPGTKVEQPVSLVDLYPTFLKAAGAQSDQIECEGFYSLLNPSPLADRPFLIAENTAPKSQDSVVSRMLRNGQYKFIWKSNQQHELYDLDQDPEEQVNLIRLKPDICAEMSEKLASWKSTHEAVQVKTNQAEYDEIIIERLRDLGYVD